MADFLPLFYNRHNFCYILFAFLRTKPLPKRDNLLPVGANFQLRLNPFSKQRLSNLDRVVPLLPENIAISFTLEYKKNHNGIRAGQL